MNDVTRFLKENTFYCDILRANITVKQCEANRAAATEMLKIKRHNMSTTDDGEERLERKLVASGFWNRGEDAPTIKCVGCAHYVPPPPHKLLGIKVGAKRRRYGDTDNGRVERQLIAYITHTQEVLNGEKYCYLSKTSPVSADVSDVHCQSEEVDTYVHQET